MTASFLLSVLIFAVTFGGIAYAWGQLGLFVLVQHRREAGLPAPRDKLEWFIQGIRAMEEVRSKQKGPVPADCPPSG